MCRLNLVCNIHKHNNSYLTQSSNDHGPEISYIGTTLEGVDPTTNTVLGGGEEEYRRRRKEGGGEEGGETGKGGGRQEGKGEQMMKIIDINHS